MLRLKWLIGVIAIPVGICLAFSGGGWLGILLAVAGIIYAETAYDSMK